MTPSAIGIVAISLLIVLILLRVPVAVALGLVGFAGSWWFAGWSATLAQLQLVIWDMTSNFTLLTLPLFILMGQFAHQFGLGKELFQCFNTWFGRVPGGMAVTAIVSSAGFGSITGSSVATVATTGQTLMPEMKRVGYNHGLAAGALGSAGVLAILIPPSIPLVFYSAWTGTSLGALFVAGVVPGVLLMLLFVAFVLVRCYLRPELGPATQAFSWSEKFTSLAGMLPILTVLLLVLGSIYLGVATPTEGAAVGVVAVGVVAAIKRRFNRQRLGAGLKQSLLLTNNILFLLLSGVFFSRFMTHTGLAQSMVSGISELDLPVALVLMSLVLVYLLLGAILDTFSMLILTLPFAFPLVTGLNVDPIWFGVFIVMMIELALITPPIGLNVFVIKKVDPLIPLGVVYRGVWPFAILSLILVGLLILFPQLVLWLPEQLQR